MYDVNEVVEILGISLQTIDKWYAWYRDENEIKPPDMPELPKPRQIHARTARLWTEGDIEKLKLFRDWVPKGRGGLMASKRKATIYWKGGKKNAFRK